jgi:catechol 2,3-dioxygenase-like lactoylglutathione lyase family enzyme
LRPQPLIAVSDVPASSRWYQRLLGCQSGHGGRTYERLVSKEELVMQLHAWDDPANAHEHLGRKDSKPYGNGVLLWFETDDFDSAIARARALGAQVLEEPHENPNAGHREIWLRDPDGYVVVIAGK